MKRGLGVAIGTALTTAGLALHRADAGAVLGRWSTSYAWVLAFLGLVAVALATWSIRSTWRPPPGTRRVLDPVFWLDLALSSYGLGYLLAAVARPETASRALDMNLTGSTVPIAIGLDWVAFAGLLGAVLTRFPRLPVRLREAATVLAALAVSCLLLEGLARAAAVVAPTIQGFPTNRSRIWDQRYIRYNRNGFRDVDHDSLPRPGVRRLLIVGDSYAAGAGIERPEDRFGPRLAAELTRATGSQWECISAVRGNTSTRDHLEFLKQSLPLKPELVILLYVFNDISYLQPPVASLDALTQHPAGIMDRLNPLRFLFVNSFGFQEIFVRARHLRFQLEQKEAVYPYADSAVVQRHLVDLRAFMTLAESAGARAVILPFDVAVAKSEPLRQRYSRFIGELSAAGLRNWPAAEPYYGRSLEELVVARLDLHPNELANALLVEAVLPRALALADSAAPAPASGP